VRILFMAQCYAPEEVSAAVLITELATDLAQRGHHVTIVTGAPSYPQGRVFASYHNSLYQVKILDDVRVIRTWSYISPSKKFWPRLLHYGTYSATAFYGGLFGGRPDVIVSYSPPLPLGLSAWLLSRIFRVPWVLQLESRCGSCCRCDDESKSYQLFSWNGEISLSKFPAYLGHL